MKALLIDAARRRFAAVCKDALAGEVIPDGVSLGCLRRRVLVLLGVSLSVSFATSSEPPPDADPGSHGPIVLAVLGPATVGRHDRIEFDIATRGTWLNPYDPDEVAVELGIVTPSGRTLALPAFFYQAYEWRYLDRAGHKTEWMYPVGLPGWRARFALEEVGEYAATATVRDHSGATRSTAVSFSCLAKPGRGYVRVSREDPRFFGFDDGTPFFPIGQNVAFIGANQYLDSERAEDVFRKMAENGANFARVWACAEDWALAVEARKSAWGRSWAWDAPIVAVPDREGYHTDELCLVLGGAGASRLTVLPSHPVALRPNTEYELSGQVLTEPDTVLVLESPSRTLGEPVRSAKRRQWTRFTREFKTDSLEWWMGDLSLRADGKGRVWLRQLSLQEAGGGPELLWEADLQRAPRGFYNQPDSFMLDRVVEAAERHGIHLQLCLLTRDHYMRALADPGAGEYQRAIDDARKLLRYAVARWGYAKSVFAWEYFNEMNPNAPTDRFYRELGAYLERIDPYRHLRTTSAWSPTPNYWAHPQLDIADAHWYLRPAGGELWKDEVAAVMDRAKLIRGTVAEKPALLAEFGLADDAWGRSPYLQQDKSGVHFHNSLWASAFSGLSGTTMFWWWETLDQMDAYRHYRPLAAFVADIPFTKARLQPVSLATAKQCRAYAWLGADCAYCWIHNPQATW